jgi:hypothetical protein
MILGVCKLERIFMIMCKVGACFLIHAFLSKVRNNLLIGCLWNCANQCIGKPRLITKISESSALKRGHGQFEHKISKIVNIASKAQ